MSTNAGVDCDGHRAAVGRVSALPPWHTATCLVAIVAVCLHHCWGLNFLTTTRTDDSQSPDQLDDSIASDAKNAIAVAASDRRLLVAVARLVFGTIMLGDSFYVLLWGKWEQDFVYTQGSKLQGVRNVRFRGIFVEKPYSFRRGIFTLSSFTMWAWTIEGVAFVLLGTIPLLIETGFATGADSIPLWIYRLTIVAWEISAPTSLLVSAVVKYILWPEALRDQKNAREVDEGEDNDNDNMNKREGKNYGNNNSNVLKHPGALMEHNLNSIAALFETGLLGGVPVRYSDITLAPLFGLSYVLFSYAMMHRWPVGGDADDDGARYNSLVRHQKLGPHFMYPFLDPTLPGITPTLALLALLLALMISFAIFCFVDRVLASLGGGWVTHLSVVIVLSACVCRFRD